LEKRRNSPVTDDVAYCSTFVLIPWKKYNVHSSPWWFLSAKLRLVQKVMTKRKRLKILMDIESTKRENKANDVIFFVFVEATVQRGGTVHLNGAKCILFSVVFTPPPSSHRGSVWLLPEPPFLNVYGAQESVPRNEFRQPM
jgi:hypothetical protein